MSPAPASSAEFRLGVAADGCVSVVVSLTSDSYPLFSYEAYGGTGDWPFVLFVAVVDGFGVFGAAVLFESFAFSALLGVRRAFRFFSGCFFNLKQDESPHQASYIRVFFDCGGGELRHVSTVVL